MGRVRLLACDPELGLRVPPDRVARARNALVAPELTLDRGVWEVPDDTRDHGHLGFLIVDGLLARDVILAGTTATELLGEGEPLAPATTAYGDGLVRCHVLWHVLEPTRLVVLDGDVARELGQWPQVLRALLERSVRRNVRMAIHQALLQLSPVETRLLVLLWFLAERWGKVTSDGIALRLRLSHELLGQLVGCRRASVTTALGRVTDSGLVERRDDGTWLLRGSPPDEFAHLHWHQRDGVPRDQRMARAVAAG